jgi:FixJ family two-component response regulator
MAMGQAKFVLRRDISRHPGFALGRPGVTGRPPSPDDDLASTDQSIVFVVDDDESMRRALSNLLQSVGLQVEVFGSAPELMRRSLPDVASCLVLDVRLPGLSGLDFQSELAKANIHIPIVFMTGHGDIPMSVMAMKAGAVDFLSKPFRQQEMLHAVAEAIGRDRKRRKDERILSDARTLFDTLTPREREVLSLVSAGLMNKQIAAEIGIAEITVKIHRGHVMKKMRTRSLADLVRLSEILGIRGTKP